MMPPAPPRFSITTGWPRSSCSAGTKLRAAISVPPPGAAGTMRWIGLVGYCAAAGGMAKCAANITRESVAIGLVIARRPTNPRLPKKKAQPAKRTGYALNSLGDYPRMASRARVCHGGGFSLFRRFSAGVRQHLVGDAHVRLAVRGNSVVGLRGGAARGSARRDPGRAVRHADPHLRHNRHRSDDDCRRHADRAGGLNPRSRHDVRGDHDRVQRDGRTLIASGWLALPRADLQLAGRERIPGGDHSPRRAGADSAGFHLVSGSDAIAAARDFSDGDVGGAVRRLPRDTDAEAPAVFHRRRRRDRKRTWYRRPPAGSGAPGAILDEQRAHPGTLNGQRTATWLLPNQNNVYCFDEHTDRIPLFHAEVREGVQRHDGGDIDRTVDADLDLAHKRTSFDFRDFSDNVVSCSVFHAALQRRNPLKGRRCA